MTHESWYAIKPRLQAKLKGDTEKVGLRGAWDKFPDFFSYGHFYW